MLLGSSQLAIWQDCLQEGQQQRLSTQRPVFRTGRKGGRVIGWQIWLYPQIGTHESGGWNPRWGPSLLCVLAPGFLFDL